MAQPLQEPASLPEEPRSFPNTCVTWLTTAFNSRSRDPDALSGFPGHLHSYVYTPPHDMLICAIKT